MTKKKNTFQPTDSELEILHILWEDGPQNVRYVNEQLNKKGKAKKEIGYTTTLKLMQIMVEKNLLSRNTSTRTHVYQAKVKQEDTQNALLKRFVDATFKGSAMNLVMQALGNHKSSKDELEEIKALIEKIEKQK